MNFRIKPPLFTVFKKFEFPVLAQYSALTKQPYRNKVETSLINIQVWVPNLNTKNKSQITCHSQNS